MSAARIILYAVHLTPPATLLTKLEWIPFYGQSKINKCAIFYKRVNGSLPDYLNEQLTINNTQHNRSIRYAGYNSICPLYLLISILYGSFNTNLIKLFASLMNLGF